MANNFSNYRKYLDSINKQNPYIPVQSLPLIELAEASELKSLEANPTELNWLKINSIGKGPIWCLCSPKLPIIRCLSDGNAPFIAH